MRFSEKCSRVLLLTLVVVQAWTTVAAAAALRTGSLPGDALGDGAAACYVTNGGPSTGAVSAVLYDMNGAPLETLTGGTVSLAAHATVSTPYHDYSVNSPAHCECVVPNTNNFRCSVVWFSKENPAQMFTVIATP